MKVSRHGDQRLLCLSSEEVSLLVDLCHAGAFSDHLSTSAPRRQRFQNCLWQVQQALLPGVKQRSGRR
ncbi:hypothetical protein KBY65_06015 [Cyanobium sp. Alchichica 3B3-8F6]|jgi:hypothetical protein|uniref:hypothetical protein n=1 Tax=unclassified Cyanobium TaxID=2627006 RepID=UPI0020CEAB4F|nr:MULTISPECIES: hypothetical protein [unclassified Cyanobium]MCP9882033.1 hypothetical protein [Cyanobium sp. Alchichica 3B3-8F6]MCP9941200.1 hypothetical protein [Cyanobium sp. ATX 6E8]